MGTRYDTIVVGSGLGGLAAAVELGLAGRKVLVIEKHNVPGGCATSFVRGRFEFETALHLLSGIGTRGRRGGLYEYFGNLGIADQLEFLPLPEYYCSSFPGLEVTIPFGREAFDQTLAETFPEDADGIRSFMALIHDLHDQFRHMVEHQNEVNPLLFPVKYPLVARYMAATVQEVIERYVTNPKARAVICQTWDFYGLPPWELSFFIFAVGMGSFIGLGGAYVKGRSQTMSAVLLERLHQLGGESRFNDPVTRILVHDGRVQGVETGSGERFLADRVVSNADLVTTMRDLVGLEHLPGLYLKRLGRSLPSISLLNVYLGVDKTADELGIRAHETCINKTFDLAALHEGMKDHRGIGRHCWVACYNRIYPDMSPEGTAVVALTTAQMGRSWLSIPPEDYYETKNMYAERLIDLAEERFPGLRQAIEVVEVATPVTCMRYLGTLDGSILGFHNYTHDHTVFRPSNRGPVEGLYLASAWSRPGGGMETALISGHMAADTIKFDLKSQGRR